MSDLLPLLEALRWRLAVVADHAFRDRDPAGHLAALQAAAQRLDRESAALSAPVDPMLKHYLDRQSYQKAVAWIEGLGQQDQAPSQ